MSHAKNDVIPHIPDTPENIAKAIMKGPPKREWDYLKRDRKPSAPSRRKVTSHTTATPK